METEGNSVSYKKPPPDVCWNTMGGWFPADFQKNLSCDINLLLLTTD